MPLDTRRVNGPEASSCYLNFAPQKPFEKSGKFPERSDKRKNDDEHRPLCKYFNTLFRFRFL